MLFFFRLLGWKETYGSYQISPSPSNPSKNEIFKNVIGRNIFDYICEKKIVFSAQEMYTAVNDFQV